MAESNEPLKLAICNLVQVMVVMVRNFGAVSDKYNAYRINSSGDDDDDYDDSSKNNNSNKTRNLGSGEIGFMVSDWKLF